MNAVNVLLHFFYYSRLKQGKFTETAEQAELSSSFTAKTDSIDNFVSECHAEWQCKKFTRAEIYTMYLEYCENAGIDRPVTNQNFHSVFARALADNKIPVRNGQLHDGSRYYEFI